MAERSAKSMFSMSSMFNFSAIQKPSQATFAKNLRQTGAFAAFIVTLASVIAYYILARTYQTHLEKQQQLTALLNNPNARVASGKKGKEVVKKIQAKVAATKKASPDSVDELLKVAQAKKTLKAANETLLSEYKAPAIVEEPVVVQASAQPHFSYQLIEPQVPKAVTIQQPPQQ